MAADTPTPLATFADLSGGPFADLVAGYSSPDAQNQLMLEATRACESACDRRFAPFAGITESQRADSLDIEDALDAYVPLDATGSLGFDRALSLGSTMLVRHCWVSERPARYSELWSGSVSSINLLRSFSGTQQVDASQVQYESDTGHIRFQLGTFVPPGTTVAVTYSGGYQTVPADLARACKYMAASIAVRELDPASSSHDPDLLYNNAMNVLKPYVRA